MNDIFESREYKRSRKAYTAQAAAEYGVTLFITDSFLAKLLSHIGISDSLTGIISSFITMAFAVQMFSLVLVRVKTSTKKIVMTFDTISMLFYMLLYFIPFLAVGKSIKTILVVICVLTAYLCKYLVSTLLYKWANSYVSPDKRATFTAGKEIISLIIGMIITLVAGSVMSTFENMNNIEAGFLFLGISILIMGVSNLVFMSMIQKEPPSEKTGEYESLPSSVKNIFANKDFRNIVVLTTLWHITFYFTNGFIGTYKNNDLMMSVVLIQVVNIIASLVRAFVTAPLGKYSDKFSFVKGYELGLIMAGIGFVCLVFTTKETWWMIILYTIFINCSQAGITSNSANMTYSYVDSKYVASAMAVKNCIGGTIGFLSSVAAGKLLGIIQANGNMLFGFNIYGQQVLGMISLCLVCVTFVFSKVVVEKQKIIVQ